MIMFVNKMKFLIIYVNIFLKSEALKKLDLKKDNIIVVTESAIRNTTNNLFIEFKFNKKVNPKIKQALLVHSFFTSVTLKDQNTLNLIENLSRVDKNKINNETEHIMYVLNEILNEDWDGTENDSLANNEGIIEYIDEFLNNLNGFKENNSYKDEYEKLDIKDEIIHILKSENPAQFHPAHNKSLSTAKFHKEKDDYLSDIEFWAPQPTRRIFQGSRTKIKHFPFMSSIQIFNTFQCAGSIIKSDLIVTAASCLQLAWNNRFFRENPAFLSARIGTTFYNGGGENIPILEVYFHPDYDPKTLRNNVAILRLLRHIKFRVKSKNVKKIDIDRTEASLSMNTDGITIVGWGARGTSNIVRDPWSNQLSFAVLDIYHPQECQEIYSREYMTRTNFCAGFVSKGGGACNHDVGGPGVVNGILTGIISFGSPVCGTPDAPTVFTKVGYYADWIEEIMEQVAFYLHIFFKYPAGELKVCQEVKTVYQRTTLKYPSPLLTNQPPFMHPTTFKIQPLNEKELEQSSYNTGQALRLLADKGLFNEFLSAMFNSREANEYRELFKDVTPVIDGKDDKTVKKSGKYDDVKTVKTVDKSDYENILAPEIYKTEKVDFIDVLAKKHFGPITSGKLDVDNSNKATQIQVNKTNEGIHELAIVEGYHIDKELYNSDEENQKKITVFDKAMFEPEDEDDEVIGKLIDNINLSDTGEKSEASAQSSDEDKKGTQSTDNVNNIAREEVAITHLSDQIKEKPHDVESHSTPISNKKDRNDVLTLLYVSDNEKNTSLNDVGDAIEDFDEHLLQATADPEEEFEDLSFRNNITNSHNRSLLDIISRGELYDLLSEAIDEVAKYNKP